MLRRTEPNCLKEFQDRLMTLLTQDLEPQEVIARLQNDPRFASLRSYIDSFDLDMIAVASELVAKWGREQELPTDQINS